LPSSRLDVFDFVAIFPSRPRLGAAVFVNC
jgi:hypothetical protein